MKKADLKKYKLSDSPGIYMFFGKEKKILYIGRATSLKDRVKPHKKLDCLDTQMIINYQPKLFVQTN